MLNFHNKKTHLFSKPYILQTCPKTSSLTVKVRSRISVMLLSFIHCKLWWNSSSKYSRSLKSQGLGPFKGRKVKQMAVQTSFQNVFMPLLAKTTQICSNNVILLNIFIFYSFKNKILKYLQ